jgi:hypothetical protein
MTVWLNTDFQGHWPVGTSAVIVADNKQQAAELLEKELERIGLSQKVDWQTMKELCTTSPGALVLQNGDY